MSDEEHDNEEDTKKEKELIESLGVSSTFDILTSKDKKKHSEEKREFRGFK